MRTYDQMKDLISVSTLERISRAGKNPPLSGWNDTPGVFQVHENYGLRKAICPILWFEEDRSFTGLGTAFSLDEWGGLLTADHVISDARLREKPKPEDDGSFSFEISGERGLVAMLGHDRPLGDSSLKKGALAHILDTVSPALPEDNPISILQGKADHRPFDMAILRYDTPGRIKTQNLPISQSPPIPNIGDRVVALGYPGMSIENNPRPNVDFRITDVLAAAYGWVTDVYPNGRDRSNFTPVFQVDAYWPSGMSGGPVFNSQGEVIGIVSRSIAPKDNDTPGTGWATMLGAIPNLAYWAPTLAHEGPDYRAGWTTSDYRNDHPIYYLTESEALAEAKKLAPHARIYRSEHKIGSIESIVYQKWQ